MNKRIKSILQALSELYPNAHCELNYKTPFELLIATILSAQTTDVKVNLVAPALFALAPSPNAMLDLPPAIIEKHIRSIGLYRMKTQNILATCKMLVNEFGSQVPQTREELMKLPGVGRKTANVVLGTAFHIPAMPVDTHVLRVSGRLGLSSAKTPEQVEQDLTALLPENMWTKVHHQLIWHGRRMCKARQPLCSACPCFSYCLEHINV